MCLGVLTLFGPSTAHAYRTFADDPEVLSPAAWESADVRWEVSAFELDEDRLRAADLLGALESALRTCSTTMCSVPDLTTGGTVAEPAAPADGRNTVSVVASDWVGRGFPSGQGATTDLELERRSDGTVVIVEADIYLNLAAYRFVLQGATSGELDLQAVLTHELLHTLGLLHNCEQETSGGAPICEPEHRASAVYPVYLGDGPRTPSVDDIDGLCALYPAAPASCDRTCGEGMVCLDGECVGGGESQCSFERLCAEGVCGLAGNNQGFCLPEGSSGAPCEFGADCTSRLCVSGSGVAYCTVECSYDDQCAGMQRCAEVDGRSVCAPLSESTGCGVARRPGDSSLHWLLAGLVVVLCLGSRRKVFK